MKRATGALRAFLTDTIGAEGAFLAIGTACLAVGAGISFGSAGPWYVVGIVGIVIGVLLAAPRRSA